MTLRPRLAAPALLALAIGCSTPAPKAAPPGAPGALAVTVDAAGYHPSELQAPAGKTVQLVFTRTSDEGCGQQLVFPGLDLRKDLPLNQPVAVDVTMPPSGALAFTCGMAMYKGSVVAVPR